MPAPKFSENFWGDEDKGFDVLLNRMRQAKATCKEVIEVISARAQLEDEFSKKLAKLSKSIVGKDETGTLKDSLNVFKSELEQAAQSHATIATDLRTKVEKALTDFVLEQSNQRKSQAKIMEKTLKTKIAQQSLVKKTKENFEKQNKDLQQLQKQDQAGNLPPKDAEKIKARLSKQTQTSEEADKAFRLSVEKMHEISTQWQMEMTQTSDMFQKLEEQRIDFVRSQLWTYSNILTAGCAADDVSNDRLRGSLEKCNIENDITVFVNEKATGKNVPEVIDYSTTRAAIVGGMPMPASSSSFSSSYNSNLSSSAPPSLSRESSSVQRSASSSFDQDAADQKGPTTPAPSTVPGCIFQVRVLYDYDPQGPEELLLHEGEIVSVVSDSEDPWWEGVSKGKQGMFPSNFVERI